MGCGVVERRLEMAKPTKKESGKQNVDKLLKILTEVVGVRRIGTT